MAEYIEREKLTKGLKIWQNTLIDTYGENDEYVRCLDSVLLGIDNAPAADVRPVVRGEWLPIIEANEYGETYQTGCICSECNEVLQHEPNFCPNCGADMREES